MKKYFNICAKLEKLLIMLMKVMRHYSMANHFSVFFVSN